MPTRFFLRGLCGWLCLLFAVPAFAAGDTLSAEPAWPEAGSENFSEPGLLPDLMPVEWIEIRINLPATRLDLFVEGKLYKSYPVAIGMPGYPTPVRDFSIEHIVWNPWWIPPDSDWARNSSPAPPGPGNPLGPVKLVMESGVRIHGTSKPESIGHAASHACIRMHSEDAAELAWEIQKRYSVKRDPQLFEQYAQNRRRSYHVSLTVPVPVSMEYKLVEFDGDKLLLHPDRYGRGRMAQHLEEAWSRKFGQAPDPAVVAELTARRPRGETVELSLQEILPGKSQAPQIALDKALPIR